MYPIRMLQDIHQTTRCRLFAAADFRRALVLEVGCGAGRVTAMYAAEARLAVGLDPDLGAAGLAARTVPEACFLCASGMAPPFRESCFDIVLFSLSLHHHPDPAQALRQAGLLLGEDGRLLIVEPTPDSEIQRLCNVFENEDHRLEAAKEALAASDMRLVWQESFSTDWRFENLDEVERYAFSYYHHPPDASKSRSIRRFLGVKADHHPVAMRDTLRLSVLGRR